MSDSLMQVPLNLGLDLTTPPLLIKPGSLVDCLNYEMTDIAGYRRIDGYEAYDGFPNGALYSYNHLTIVAQIGANQALIVPGSTLVRGITGGGNVALATVLGPGIGANVYHIASYRANEDFTASTSLLTQSDGESLMLLSNGVDQLAIFGEPGELTDSFYIITPSGVQFQVDLSNLVTNASSFVTPQEYIDNLRNYSTVLRSQVAAAPGAIAGLHWFEDRLYAAVNTLTMSVPVAVAATQPVLGDMVKWNGYRYRIVALPFTTDGTTNSYTFHLSRIDTYQGAGVNDNLVKIDTAGTLSTVWVSNATTNANPSNLNSDYATIGYFHNLDTSPLRGFTFLPSAASFSYTNGTYLGTTLPSITLDAESDPSSTYFIVGDAGASVIEVYLTQLTSTDGVFNLGTAVGEAQLVVKSVVAGTRDYFKVGDVLHSTYPTTGTSATLTISTAPVVSYVAGTKALDVDDTRYIWDSFNFYGQSTTLSAYGVNGAGRAFWMTKLAFGNIKTSDNALIDKPKYLAFHVGKLSLGFSRGSVILSVAGQPYNFLGQEGAIEVATGDDLTGLLELPGETMAVFGRRSIRKITGFTDVDTQIGTVSANSGCFDYTAVLVGGTAVYTGLNGISTLEQTAAYGDFIGQRVSSAISTWLRPRLTRSFTQIAKGGPAMALGVRSKGQYRLFLQSGEIIVVTFTADGPKITFCNLGLTGENSKVPYAWSSEVSVANKERIHVRWVDKNFASQCFELDSGWGFNGAYFRHYFDMAHIFNQSGAKFMGVEKVRMYGQSHGVATLDVKSSGIEENFDQDYHNRVQDISIPRNLEYILENMKQVTSIVDQGNWGLGIKLRFQGSNPENSSLTEPSHICQVLVLHTRTEGALDG